MTVPCHDLRNLWRSKLDDAPLHWLGYSFGMVFGFQLLEDVGYIGLGIVQADGQLGGDLFVVRACWQVREPTPSVGARHYVPHPYHAEIPATLEDRAYKRQIFPVWTESRLDTRTGLAEVAQEAFNAEG